MYSTAEELYSCTHSYDRLLSALLCLCQNQNGRLLRRVKRSNARHISSPTTLCRVIRKLGRIGIPLKALKTDAPMRDPTNNANQFYLKFRFSIRQPICMGSWRAITLASTVHLCPCLRERHLSNHPCVVLLSNRLTAISTDWPLWQCICRPRAYIC